MVWKEWWGRGGGRSRRRGEEGEEGERGTGESKKRKGGGKMHCEIVMIVRGMISINFYTYPTGGSVCW